MPVDYAIDKDRKLVISTAIGTLTATEAFDHQRRLQDDSNFQKDFCQVLDLTAVTAFDIDLNDIRQLAETSIFAKDSRRAWVAGSDLAVGLLRMMATYAELSGNHNEIRVFRSQQDATKWLFEGDPA